MKAKVVGLSLVVGVVLAGTTSAEAGRKGAPSVSRNQQPIVNKVVDLLDGEVQLSASGNGTWESPVISTAQFTRIGVRATGETDSYIVCTAEWKFGTDDEFYASGPRPYVGGTILGDFGRIAYGTPELDDDPSLSGRVRQYYTTNLSSVGVPSNFGEVAGTHVRIVCSLLSPTVVIGDDPVVDPGPGGLLAAMREERHRRAAGR